MTTPLLIDDLLQLARDAGAAILEVYNTDFDVERKQDDSPLTQADLASHHTIVEALQRLTPDIPVLSEESASIPFETRQSWDRYWLIDPLDGTKEFIKRNGEFTVNIALIEGDRPTLGVVYAPVLDRLYYGSDSEGAWLQEGDAAVKQIQVASQRRHPVLVAGSRSHAGESLQRYLVNLGEHELVSMGSSLKLCLVAQGEADLYPRLGPTSEWDTAASQAVVEAAGGRVTTLDMQPLRYNTKDSLLNPEFFVFGDDSVDWSAYL
jgi:3'(2'), 5'-bisphosphate nucleotidase